MSPLHQNMLRLCPTPSSPPGHKSCKHGWESDNSIPAKVPTLLGQIRPYPFQHPCVQDSPGGTGLGIAGKSWKMAPWIKLSRPAVTEITVFQQLYQVGTARERARGGSLRTASDSRPGNGPPSSSMPQASRTYPRVCAPNSTIGTDSLLIFNTEYCEAQVMCNCFVSCEELDACEILIYHTASLLSGDPPLCSGTLDPFVVANPQPAFPSSRRTITNELECTERNTPSQVNQASSIVLYY